MITGIPSHGKSEWLDALMVNLVMKAGWSFVVFSPENRPIEFHLRKLAKKVVGKPFDSGPIERMTRDELDDTIDWLNKKFAFVLPEEPTVDCILDLAKVLVFRKDIRGLVIDPWNELEHSRPPNLTETEYISQALSRIRSFARTHDVHVWVVAHPTKLQKDKNGEYPVPTPYDVSGSAHWRNKADNCLCVWRDLGDKNNRVVEVHVQKVRFSDIGRAGEAAELIHHLPTGKYFDVKEAPQEIVYD